MRTTPGVLRAAAMLGVMVGLSCDRAVEPTPPILDVFTPGNTFSPFTATIPVGGTVRFNIFGDDHNVIFARATAGAPSDINIVKDVMVERAFSAVGTFPYSCTVHPGMNGEIVVR
ncbi:MAG: hypothetical protein ABIR92_10185 [Gemmatimonadaceae bacterium]